MLLPSPAPSQPVRPYTGCWEQGDESVARPTTAPATYHFPSSWSQDLGRWGWDSSPPEGLCADPGGTPSHPLESGVWWSPPPDSLQHTADRRTRAQCLVTHRISAPDSRPRWASSSRVVRWAPRGPLPQADQLVPIGRPPSLPKALVMGRAEAWVFTRADPLLSEPQSWTLGKAGHAILPLPHPRAEEGSKPGSGVLGLVRSPALPPPVSSVYVLFRGQELAFVWWLKRIILEAPALVQPTCLP